MEAARGGSRSCCSWSQTRRTPLAAPS